MYQGSGLQTPFHHDENNDTKKSHHTIINNNHDSTCNFFFKRSSIVSVFPFFFQNLFERHCSWHIIK